jgi:hypothetical protein
MLLGLGDDKLSDAEIDRRAILSGVAMLEKALEKAIVAHFRNDIEEPEKNKLFGVTDEGFSVLTTFSARI